MAESLPPPILYGGIALALAIFPLLFLLVTPFMKLSIVFGVLRTGFGSQGVPGTAALTALSLVLSLHLIEPAFERVGVALRESAAVLSERKARKEPPLERVVGIIARESAPLKEWLREHSGEREIHFFQTRRQESAPSIFSLIPAFVLTELRLAFRMALYLFIPFLVIDLLVTTVLTAMGMMMVNPVMISFPLKLLLFVECDGWFELSQAILRS